MNKKNLTERDICTKFLTPAVRDAGWDVLSQIREQVYFTKGRIIVRGKRVTRGKAKFADYVLYYKPNIPIALIEAKDNNHPVGGGMQQALEYAATLDIPFVFSSNGDAFLLHDRTGLSAQTETELALDAFPTPEQLWARYRAWKGLVREEERIVLQDYHDDATGKEPRYYQRIAINKAIEAIAKGRDRVLLVMATGTGKTYTAFQILWRLWKSGRKKRILYLADRNVLIDQTMVNENADLVQQNPRYVMRITGDDPEGVDQVGNFIDPEAKYPVIVTTSRLLSTGVDAQTCRLIVLDREVGSMTEFKQIMGRGTRVHEDTQKYYFTLLDFRKATNHFADPDFDGVPVQIYEPGEGDPVSPPDEVLRTSDGDDSIPAKPGNDEEIVYPGPPYIATSATGTAPPKYYINGKEVAILAERIEYLDENGKLVTESLRDYSKRTLRKQFASLDAFLKRWKGAERKQVIIGELAAEGLLLDPLGEEVGKDLDPFDLICHVAFDQPPLTRRERADNVRKRDVFTRHGAQARAVLEALLQKYQDEGVTDLDDPRILKIAPFDAMGTPVELLKTFGGRDGFDKAVHELQSALYDKAA